MSENKATRGPWVASHREDGSGISYVTADTGHIEVAVSYSRNPLDAQLMASAPDLLAALKASLDVIALMSEWAGCVSDQAIDGPGERSKYRGDLALALEAARIYQAVIAKAEGKRAIAKAEGR
ncbi:MAG: hypothetical protein ACKVQA_06895 [Burkholderiales bacterium]